MESSRPSRQSSTRPDESQATNTKQVNLTTSSKSKMTTSSKSKIISKIKVGSYNPRSINNKTIEVVEYFKDLNLDVILIQESWLYKNDDSKLAEIKEMGYTVYSNPRKRRGGGVAVLFKDHFKVKLKE